VVDRGSLENCCTLRGTGGSNPSLSAKENKSRAKPGFCIKTGRKLACNPVFYAKDHPARSDGRDLYSFTVSVL
jgi:hypothetical protein